jgi:hypothetical protein
MASLARYSRIVERNTARPSPNREYGVLPEPTTHSYKHKESQNHGKSNRELIDFGFILLNIQFIFQNI